MGRGGGLLVSPFRGVVFVVGGQSGHISCVCFVTNGQPGHTKCFFSVNSGQSGHNERAYL